MPRYTYVAKIHPQKTVQAEIEAESEQDAVNKITKMGYFPVSITFRDLSSDKNDSWRFWKKSKKEIQIFTRQLATLVESGVNIINSLNIISEQTSNKYLKAVLSDVISRIKDGKSLHESLSAYPRLFPNLYISMLHSGEAGGNLDVSLKRLADFLEKEEEFKNSLRAALTYPVFIFAVSILTIVVLVGFVIPRLATMFEDMGQLPLPTRVLLGLSGFLSNYWWMILLILAVSVFLLRRFSQTYRGRFLWDNFKLKCALAGGIVLKTEVSRLTRTMSLLLSSGIPVVRSLEISTSIIENQILKIELLKFKGLISEGASFSSCLKDSKLFPSFTTNIVAVGEETGTLEKALLRISDDYEREVDRSLKALSRLLEPVIILVMGVIVAFIVLSMLLPIFQINLIVS